MTTHCDKCNKDLPDSDYFTEVNPEGGYGCRRVLVCDRCMAADDMAWWRADHWPNWPNERTPYVNNN